MIITLTMNPAVDRTATLGSPLTRGGAHRIVSVDDRAGGAGVDVARVVRGSGVDVLAVVPAPATDPFVEMCATSDLPLRVVPVTHPVRVDLTLVEPDGTTTTVESPGADDGERSRADVTAALDALSGPGDWVVFAGGLPAGAPADLYARLVPRLRARGVRVAVDTSGSPLHELVASLPGAAPDLLAPDAEDLAGIVGADGAGFVREAAAGEFTGVFRAARALCSVGTGSVLVTLGDAGAVLVDGDGAWFASPPPVGVGSTAGARAASLAGYLVAETRGVPAHEKLAWAVAHRAAAVALPGTRLPSDLDVVGLTVSVTRLEEHPG